MLLTRSLLAFVFIAFSFDVAGASSDDDLKSALKVELDREASDGRFAGAVLVAHSGTPIFVAANGEANIALKQPNTQETKFRFGSMGKMFTAVAIAQLVQAGKVEVDAPLSKYLPDYPNKQVAKVTIHQLLTHTGGTGDIFGPEFIAQRSNLKEIRDYVRLFGARDPLFAPGSRHEYSNFGFILLGRVIEVVSGRSYDAYVREQIFAPAGMSSTDNLPEDRHIEGLAVPYGPGLSSAEDALPYRGTSAGGGYTTVGDLLKFANALVAHRLLDAKHTELITIGKVDTPMLGMRYAYGFEDATLPDGTRRIGHSGGAPGINGVLSIYPQSGYVVAVLANRDPPAAMEIDRFIARRLAPPPSRP